uniref:Carboxylesterase type B domain-containing protein n=1 Tax=Acanthochromis polyacanthus TaxID=80966 RepID=A0A3Q1GWF6_9TELE
LVSSVLIICVYNIDSNEQLRYSISVDGHFLKKPAHELLREHELLTVPFITGVNDDEGGWIQILKLELSDSTVTSRAERDLMMKEYFGNGKDRVKNREGLTEMIGDVIFNIPVIETANAHRGAAVYLYEFQHSPKTVEKIKPSFVGSDHGDEILIMFGFCFTTAHLKFTGNAKCFTKEEQLSRTMMSYWGNFARTGSPNGDGLAQWPKYGAEEEYLAIGLKEQVVGRGLNKDRFVFMTQTLPEKVQQHKENMENGK